MRHKCPGCNVSLVPITRIVTDNRWINTHIDAERAMHLEDGNYFYWKCPECGRSIASEIEKMFCGRENYEDKKIFLKRKEGKKGEHCDT